ncbi:MFS transporter [Paenibacillus cookii]|uniref:Transporter YwbF n=1 Tax=Paenibacillus cookii TaxID=157839 RepID=A0ABQ4LT94_9BACL|nr:MFS transporter [Paenibacillus cookii]KHF32181.1 putative 3-phenylpropionic acid transporter [Paenibacillus sp. P1XP2]GIO65971.1 putative transporter YwbF [Paenibacillus cookii]
MRSSFTVKSFNFLFFALLSMFIPFLPLYFSEQGLNETQIGSIIGIGGFITLIAQPLWGMISDRTRTIRKVLLILVLCSTATGFLLYSTDRYALILLFVMLTYFFLMPVDPLTESLNFRVAESAGISYGSLRTYGALGYAVMSLAAGYLMTQFGSRSLGYTFAGLGAISLVVTYLMPDAPVSGKPVTMKSLKNFLSNKETLLFLILVFISSIPARMNDTFLGLYIKDLGGKPDLLGLAWFLAAGSEILVFSLSFWWLRKNKELAIISFAGAFYFLRFFISAWIEDPNWLAYIQLLQLLTFPVFYTAAIQYLYNIVPVEWRATGQTVLALLFFGVSGILSSFAGGALYQAFGGRTMYLTISCMSFIGMLFGIVLYRMYGRKKSGEGDAAS